MDETAQHDTDMMEGIEANSTAKGRFKLTEFRTDCLFIVAQKLAPVVKAHLNNGSMSTSDPLPQLHEKVAHARTFASQIPLIAEAHARTEAEHSPSNFTSDEIAVHGPVYGFFPPSTQAKLINDTATLLPQSPREAAKAMAGLWAGRKDIDPAIRSAFVAVVCNPSHENAITDPTAKGIALGGAQSPHLVGLASGLDCMDRRERAATVTAVHSLTTAIHADPSILDKTHWPIFRTDLLVEALHKGVDSLNETELAQLREDAPVLDHHVPRHTRQIQQSHPEMAIDTDEEYAIPKSVDAFYSDTNPLHSAESDSDTMSAYYQHANHFKDMTPEVRSAVLDDLVEWDASDSERKLDIISHMALKMDILSPNDHQILSNESVIWQRPDPDTNGALAVGISKWWEAQKEAHINEASRNHVEVSRPSTSSSTKREREIDEISDSGHELRQAMIKDREKSVSESGNVESGNASQCVKIFGDVPKTGCNERLSVRTRLILRFKNWQARAYLLCWTGWKTHRSGVAARPVSTRASSATHSHRLFAHSGRAGSSIVAMRPSNTALPD